MVCITRNVTPTGKHEWAKGHNFGEILCAGVSRYAEGSKQREGKGEKKRSQGSQGQERIKHKLPVGMKSTRKDDSAVKEYLLFCQRTRF